MVQLLARERVEAEARRFGVVERQRKVDIFALVWTLVLGFQVGAKRTLEGLRQAYEARVGETIVRSAFYTRLTSKLAQMLRSLALESVEKLGPAVRLTDGHLAGFRELLAIDSMVIRLHKLLAQPYPACRTNHTQAAAKLHVVMRVLDGSPSKVKLTSERTNDRTPWRRVESWVKGCLLLFDLGYYSFHMFYRIDEHGGFFLSRLKGNGNPLIVASNRRWRGQSIEVVGKRLKDVLPHIQREVLDVQVEVSFQRRSYRGKSTRSTKTFRLVAVRNDETGAYHCYLTNVPADRLPAEQVTATYALRWQVELLFKALSSHGHLRQLPTSKQEVTECLIWASVLAATASQALYRAVRRSVDQSRHMPPLRWAVTFSRHAADLLTLIIAPDPVNGRRLFSVLVHDAPDPNITRQDRSVAPVPVLTDA
jgi:IS4 transposase